MDKPLQRYIEHWKNFNVLISSNAITSQDYCKLSVRDVYKEAWNDFYQNKYIPCIKNRNIECHVNGIGDEKMEKIIEKTRENIEKYEKTILRQY